MGKESGRSSLGARSIRKNHYTQPVARLVGSTNNRDTRRGRSTSGGKLRGKMRDATLGEDQVLMAVELRRDYAKTVRTSRYMESTSAQRLQSRVKSELASLRARFVAGQIPPDPVAFHSLCIHRMNVINSERSDDTEDQSAFLIGCMYDIADRCLHQFTKLHSEIT